MSFWPVVVRELIVCGGSGVLILSLLKLLRIFNIGVINIKVD